MPSTPAQRPDLESQALKFYGWRTFLLTRRRTSRIVAFTFTERAGAELKDRITIRVRDALGEVHGMAEMYVGTIHGYCLQLLQSHMP